MNGTAAGWYDDPEQPGQQRYWDGTAWTEDRAPGATPPPPPPGAPTQPPAGAPGPVPPPGAVPPPPGSTPPPPAGAVPPPSGAAPPPSSSPKSSRKGLWIVLGVIGAVVVLAFIAILAVTFLGSSSDVTGTIEENLPPELESNFVDQGLDVSVTKVECEKVDNDEGPFTTDCDITIAGLDQPLKATITGTVEGRTVTVTDASSDTTVLDENLAVIQSQPVIDSVAAGVTVTSCTLPEPVVAVSEGLSFTCDTDSDETVTLEVQGGQLVITDVQ